MPTFAKIDGSSSYDGRTSHSDSSQQASEIEAILKNKETVNLKIDFAIDRSITKSYVPGLALAAEMQIVDAEVNIEKFGIQMTGCASGLAFTRDIIPSSDTAQEELIKLINKDTSCQLKITYIYLCENLEENSPCRYTPSPKPLATDQT